MQAGPLARWPGPREWETGKEQKERGTVDELLRNSPLELGGEVRGQRHFFHERHSVTVITPRQPVRPAPAQSNQPQARRRGVRDEAARGVTATERGGSQPRWQSLSQNLIDLVDLRGGALAAAITLAVVLNVAAIAGLAYVAGFHAVHASLTRFQWPWIVAVPAAVALSATGYYFAYRRIYAAEGGYELSHHQLTAMVAAGFGGLFSTGGIRPDGVILQASGASWPEAMVRVTTLTGMEQAITALYGCAASIALLSMGSAEVPTSFTLPWAIIPVPAAAVVFWLASRYRSRLQGQAGWRAKLSVSAEAVLRIRWVFAHPVRCRGAIAGMALFWGCDALAVWCALAAFGFLMNGAAFMVGYCTGMVFTRRIAPLAGAGLLALFLPLTLWGSGAPLATALVGVAAYRIVIFYMSLPYGLVSLPVLREAR